MRRIAKQGKLCVVTYHGVRPEGYVSKAPLLDGALIRKEALRSQLRHLKSRYSVITPEQLLSHLECGSTLPPRAVLLTCDDGLRNTLTDMVPILQEHGLSCLFFVTGASCQEIPQMLWYEQLYLWMQIPPSSHLEVADPDRPGQALKGNDRRLMWWDLVKKLSRRNPQSRSRYLEEARVRLGVFGNWTLTNTQGTANARRFLLLAASELRQLVAKGMTIGAHTMTHPVLANATEEWARREIVESRSVLESTVGQRVWALAYPFGNSGSVGPREVELAKAAGYSAAFVNVGGGFGADLPPLALPRVHVTSEMSLGEFDAHVSGLHRGLRRPEPIFTKESESSVCA